LFGRNTVIYVYHRRFLDSPVPNFRNKKDSNFPQLFSCRWRFSSSFLLRRVLWEKIAGVDGVTFLYCVLRRLCYDILSDTSMFLLLTECHPDSRTWRHHTADYQDCRWTRDYARFIRLISCFLVVLFPLPSCFRSSKWTFAKSFTRQSYYYFKLLTFPTRT
jgi:hypothetical protein